MDKLAEQLKVLQASTFALYLKCHNYHWNIEGPNFSQYHAFLADLYNELWLAVDLIAEHTRTLEVYVPGSFDRFKQLSVVDDALNIPDAQNMLINIKNDNQKIIEVLDKTLEYSEAAKTSGITNFLQDRIDIHFKHAWMLKSITKVQ